MNWGKSPVLEAGENSWSHHDPCYGLQHVYYRYPHVQYKWRFTGKLATIFSETDTGCQYRKYFICNQLYFYLFCNYEQIRLTVDGDIRDSA
jgi:hypothetical protein